MSRVSASRYGLVPLGISLAAMLATQASGQVFFSDFNSGVPAGMSLFRDTNNVPLGSNAVVEAGYLKLTRAQNGALGSAVIDDFGGGGLVTRFTATFKASLFGSTCCGGGAQPADGFSFNLAPATIPLPPVYGATAAEEGIDAGLAVTFDTWDNGGGEAPAIEVKWQGVPVPGARRAIHPSQSPVGAADAVAASKNVFINLDPDGKITVVYGNDVICDRVQTPYDAQVIGAPKWVLGARTGGANDNHWIDDLRIVTVTPPQVVVPATAAWAYNDATTAETTLHGTGWQGVAYDTNSALGWKTGEALFGNDSAGLYDTASHPYAGRGLNGFSTPLDRLINGAAARITFYLRAKFNWPTSGAGVTLSATSWVDDGVVAYVNGTEAYRLRVPDAPAVIDWTTLGSNPPTEGAPENSTWTAGTVVQGENVVAVELHQSSAGSSDVAFGMAISANQPVPPTIASAIEPTNRVVFASRSTTLSALAYGAPAPSYQWYKDGVAIDPAVNPTATSAGFEIPVMAAADAGNYYCIVSNVLGAATTRTAAVEYLNDPNPPVMVRAVAAATFDSIIVEFDELIDPTTVADPFEVSVSGGSIATVGPGPGGRSALITLDAPLSSDTQYTVTMGGVKDLIGNTIAAGSSIQFRTFVTGPGGGILFEAFPGIAGNLVNDLVAHPSFPNSPTDRIAITGFNSRQAYPDDSHETYGARMRGLFIPPVSGNWVFYMAADDGSRLLFNPNGPDAAGRQVLLNRDACCGDYTSANSRTTPQALIAGQGYYIELLYKEGGGGDWGQVAATLQGEPVPALTSFIPGSQLGVPSAPAGVGGVITITQQPANVSLLENRTYSFSVAASNPNGLPQFYQWLRNGVEIPGATSPTYSGLSTVADNGAQFSVRVVMIGNSVLSSEASLAVEVDDDAPNLIGASADDTLKSLVLRFDELIDGASVDPFGFTVSGGITVQNAVMGADGRSVVVTVSPLLAEDTQYTVTASGVADRASTPNVIGTLTATIRTLAFHRGFLNFSVYNGTTGPTTAGAIGGNSIADLTGHPTYPSFPSESLFTPGFDTRTVFPTDAHEAYGGRLSGFFIPPTSGNWIFHLNADDGSRLMLNPAGPSPEGAIELTALDLCCAAFGVQFSTPQALVAGQRYYIEAIYKEGGGGDYCRVAAQLEGDTTPPTSLLPIPGAYLGALVDGTGASVNITQQPANQTFVIASDSLLAEDFTSSGGGFTVETPVAFNVPWTHNPASGSWEVVQDGAEIGQPMTSILTSPEMTVTKSTALTVRFSHRHSFEIDSTRWDGGNLQVSVNGGPFTVVPDSAFAQNGYGGNTVGSGSRSVLANQPAFTGNSANFEGGPITSQATLGSFAIGDKVKIRFVYGGDTNTRGQFVPSWQISSVNVDQGSVQSVTFTVAATATRPGSNPAPIAYQWYRDSGSGFALIPGATGTSYTVVPRCDDTGDRFRVEVLTPGATAMSTAATLTVAVPNTAPSFGLTPPPAGAEDSGPVTVPSVARNIAPGTAATSPSGDRINVFTPGDPLTVVSGVDDGDGAAGAPPAAEGGAQAIDGFTQKYLNFLDLGSGFAATPSKGKTIVTGARFFTANDAEVRDPASYTIEGSTVGIDGPWTLISSGALSLPATRNAGGTTPVSAAVHANQTVDFANTAAYVSYRVVFPTLKNAASANSMQIAEVELLGTVQLPKTNVLSAADAVVLVNGSNDGDASAGAPPGAEGVARAIDGTTTKYLNFLDLGSGFVVTPAKGSTLVEGIRLFTANDAEERDPASYVLEGSNAGADGPWTLISSGALSLPATRNPGGVPIDPATQANQLVEFVNTVGYTSYRVTFPTLKNASAANSMQIGEVQLIGGGYTPPSCGDESSQTVSFTVSNDNPSLFTVQPAISPNGTLTYTPAANQCGSAVVTVVAVDSGDTSFGGRNTSAPQTFTLNVACVNDCPTATGQSLAVDQGSSVNFQLVGSDIDSTALQYVVTQAPAHGVVVVQAQTGAATYTPAAGYSGPDSFMFQVTDGTCNSSAVLVTINVRLVNTPPTAKIVATPLVDFSPDIVNKVLISCNGSNACVQLDGSLSSDRETPASQLTYAWSVVPSPLPFSDDVITEICLELGTQTILLTVTDAAGATGTDSLTIEVLSAGEAIDELITKINDSTVARKNKRPFIATLKAAAASAERGQNHTTANQLGALQNKIRAQIAPSNPADAATWIAWTQSIIDALNRCGE